MVYLETAYLTDEEASKACKVVKEAGADYVCNGSHYSLRGVAVRDVKLMRKAVGPSFKVAAGGGVKTTEQALALIEARANRIFSSAAVAIAEGLKE